MEATGYLTKTMKRLLIFICLPLFSADTKTLKERTAEAEIRDVHKWNAQYQKLAQAERIAATRKNAFVASRARECQDEGMILNVTGGGWLDCVQRPEPPPPPKPEEKK